MRELAVVDFETKAIDYTNYPPEPVGFALDLPGRKPEYFAWGHPEGNSCDKALGRRRLKDVYEKYDVLFHHAQFDIDVSQTHLGIKPIREVHDTLFLAFLHDPHALSLELKVLAEKICGVKPRERDALQAWIFEHIPGAKRKKSEWGAHISKAPGNIVAPYACGDVTRPRRLFKFYEKKVLRDSVGGSSDADFSMVDAYRREVRMIDIVLKMQHRGLLIDRKRLAHDLKAWRIELADLQRAAARILRTPGLDLGKAEQLRAALDRSGKMAFWLMTEPSKAHPEGQRSVSWRALEQALTDRKLYAIIRRWSQISHYASTFAEPWLALSERDGRVHPIWSSTRKDEGGGARSGRFVSNPNWQNVPDPESREGPETTLPIVRNYVIPSNGNVFLSRDYIQQEFRILAHFEDGALLALYHENPWIDVHTEAAQQVSAILHREIKRKPIKGLGFGILYGQGLKRTAEEMGTDLPTARQIRGAYTKFIQIEDLQADLRKLARTNEPMRTWGGRLYYCEQPKLIKGIMRTFEYKMVNYLIQPSAADCTKQAMINADDMGIELVLSVHDDLIADTPIATAGRRMEQLRFAMERVPFNVAMLTKGKASARSWGECKDYRDPWPDPKSENPKEAEAAKDVRKRIAGMVKAPIYQVTEKLTPRERETGTGGRDRKHGDLRRRA